MMMSWVILVGLRILDFKGEMDLWREKSSVRSPSIVGGDRDLKIPVWWRRAVLPSLRWPVGFISFFHLPGRGCAVAGTAFSKFQAKLQEDRPGRPVGWASSGCMQWGTLPRSTSPCSVWPTDLPSLT